MKDWIVVIVAIIIVAVVIRKFKFFL